MNLYRYSSMTIFLFVALFLVAADAWSTEIPDALKVKTIQPAIDPAFGQGTDANSGKTEIEMIRQQNGAGGRPLSSGQARDVLGFALASLAVYDDKQYPWPADWKHVEQDVAVDQSRLMKALEAFLPMGTAVIKAAPLPGIGFHAAVYRKPDGVIVVAFEGTKVGQLDDLATDLSQLKTVPLQYRLGEVVAQRIINAHPGEHVVLTGHSLGGGIAQYAAARLGQEAVVFNSAGLFSPALKSIADGGNLASAKITHVVTQGVAVDTNTITYLHNVVRTKELISKYGAQLGATYVLPIRTTESGLSLHKMARLYKAIAAVAQVGERPSTAHSIIVVVDSSGSMSSSDPKNLRREAVKRMIALAGEMDRIALIDFDSSAREVSGFQLLGDFNSSARRELRNLAEHFDAGGGTDIGAGLKLAARLANNQSENLAVILMTDGEDPEWNGEADGLPAGVPVHAIALSEAADRSRLSKLSAATGGVYQIAESSSDLARIMDAIFGEAADKDVLLIEEGTIREGDVQEYTLYLAGVAGLTEGSVDVEVTWPGSDIDLTLIDPNGKRYQIEQAVRDNIGIEEGTYDIIRLQNPVAGTWRVAVKGVDIAPGGEPYTVRVTSSGSPLKARWKTNVVTPEVGQPMSIEIQSENNKVRWQQAEVEVYRPDGTLEHNVKPLDGLFATLGGSSGQAAYIFRSEAPGVYRVKIVATGTTDNSQKVMRTFDRTFEVAPPGLGVRYKHQIDPFIRRRPGMLQ
ncbi:hypothetical protein C2E25_16615 [Geothermobacter hydrogeniphilus]|uniref:VWFA domain-containing protein n=1 Tax=Geothermobacter hydrogeniphilus TaxID=1969733 RepID=A0A2K2H5P5_9BACT|nr:VWA domain-containing protein [Geothermobacter hydrogeniphilus]PNU18644.1 hypothetical protein C2E25_16615 [Geothermobacter hydrogeniphilus]